MVNALREGQPVGGVSDLSLPVCARPRRLLARSPAGRNVAEVSARTPAGVGRVVRPETVVRKLPHAVPRDAVCGNGSVGVLQRFRWQRLANCGAEIVVGKRRGIATRTD